MVNKLEELCAVKVVVALCCQPQVKKILSSPLLQNVSSEYNEKVLKIMEIVEHHVLDQINNLPYQIRDVIPKHLIHYIINEMINCQTYYLRYFGLQGSYSFNVLKSSHFTHKGTLDKELISRDMIQDKGLDDDWRCDIAIGSCLTGDIYVFWKEMTEDKEKLTYKGKVVEKYKFGKLSDKEHTWKDMYNSDSKNGEYDKFVRVLCAFNLTLKNEVAFKNSWRKLDFLSEKFFIMLVVNLTFWASAQFNYAFAFDDIFILNRSRMEILRFLICNSNEETLKRILTNKEVLEKPLLLLKLLLFWPYQDIFMKTLNLVWEKITDIHFYELLHSIVDMIEDDEISNTYDYRLILKEIWDLAPLDHKKYVSFMEAEGICSSYTTPKFSTFRRKGVKIKHYYNQKLGSPLTFLLSRLFSLKIFRNDDVTFVKEIASHATANEKQKIVRVQGYYICENSLMSGKFWLTNLFIECFAEKELVKNIKQVVFTRRSNYVTNLILSFYRKKRIDKLQIWVPKI